MTDQNPGAAPADPGDPGPPPAADECADCLGARVVIIALAFAAFAAYVAADFATGGRLTAGLVGALAAVRGRAEDGPGNA